jgi:hypothetical protein
VPQAYLFRLGRLLANWLRRLRQFKFRPQFIGCRPNFAVCFALSVEIAWRTPFAPGTIILLARAAPFALIAIAPLLLFTAVPAPTAAPATTSAIITTFTRAAFLPLAL